MSLRTKRRKTGSKNFLILLISLLLLMYPAFHDCCDLAETDILSSQSHLEELHPEDMAAGRQDTWFLVQSEIGPFEILFETNPTKDLFTPLFLFPADQQTLSLRC